MKNHDEIFKEIKENAKDVNVKEEDKIFNTILGRRIHLILANNYHEDETVELWLINYDLGMLVIQIKEGNIYQELPNQPKNDPPAKKEGGESLCLFPNWPTPEENERVRMLYLDLWTKDTHTEGYDKQQWVALGEVLRKAGYKL